MLKVLALGNFLRRQRFSVSSHPLIVLQAELANAPRLDSLRWI